MTLTTNVHGGSSGESCKRLVPLTVWVPADLYAAAVAAARAGEKTGEALCRLARAGLRAEQQQGATQ